METAPTSGSEVKNIVVNVSVKGETKAINALANLERQMLKKSRADTMAARSTQGLTNTLEGADRAQRRMTQSSIQAGQQIQDFAIQVQGGQRFMTAFTQQASQLAFVMANTEGKIGSLAKFLAGPWGAAVFIALAVFTPLIQSFFEASGASDDFREVLHKQQTQAETTTEALKKLRVEQEMSTASAIANIRFQKENAESRINQITGQLNDPDFGGRFNKDSIATRMERANLEKERQRLKWDVVEYNVLLNKGEQLLKEEEEKAAERARRGAKSGGGSRKAALSDEEKAARDAAKATAELVEQYNAGGKAAFSYQKQVSQLKSVLDSKDLDDASRALVLKDLAKLNADYAASLSPQAALEAQLAGAQEERLRLEEQLLLVEQARNNPALTDAQLKFLDDLYNTINRKINPAYAEQLRLEKELERRAKAATEEGQGINRYGGEDWREREKLNEQIGHWTLVALQGGKAAEVAANEMARLRAELDMLDMTFLESTGLEAGLFAIQQFEDAFTAAIQGSKSFSQAFEDMGRAVIAMIAQIAVKWAIISALQSIFPESKLIGGLKLAKGGVIENGQQVTAYAKGGVVDRPTLFPMRNGMGLMGEGSGPEAIMPLKRDSRGNLGVGGGSVNVTVINNAGANVSVDDQGDGNVAIVIDQASKAIASDIARGDGRVSKALQGTYGISRARR